jgi:hypothetical protein
MQPRTQLFKGGIGLGLEQVAHASERRLITARFPAASAGPGCYVPGRAATPQQLFDEGLADPKEGGDGTL